MESLDGLTLEELLQEINSDQRGGEDLTFSLLFDEIKEARRADPTYLPQGEWQTELKQADWPKVLQLAGDAIINQSKDLQLAGWLCEALAHRHGFVGMSFGIAVIIGLLEEFWDDLYPEVEDDDLEERSSRLEWLNSTLSGVARVLPLVEHQAYGLAEYEESRQVENKARNEPETMEQALAEGKINDEIFQRAVVLTSTEFFQQHHQSIRRTLAALKQLDTLCDQRFGSLAPSFSLFERTLGQCLELTEKLLRDRGAAVEVEAEAVDEQGSVEEGVEANAPSSPAGAGNGEPGAQQALRTTPESRAEAFQMMNSVARYFKEREPHSPVPYLIERAVKWGRMPLEEWLKDVIKDDGVIDSVRDTLGTQPKDDEN